MTSTLTNVASIATIFGSMIAVVVLFYTAYQVQQNTKVSRGQFWLDLEKMTALYDEVHINLRPGGKWSGGEAGPTSAEDWAKVEDYMGLFEHCELMLQHRLIDLPTFKALFAYRVQNILANKHIVDAKLKREKDHWTEFIRLVARLNIKYT